MAVSDTFLDEFTRTRRVERAAAKAAALGHGEIDFAHYFVVDLDDDEVGSRLLEQAIKLASPGEDAVPRFRRLLDRHLDGLAQEAMKPVHSAEMDAVFRALAQRAAPPERNLEATIDGLLKEDPDEVSWRHLLAAMLEYYPHTIRTLIMDFGLNGAAVQGLEGALAAVGGGGGGLSGESFLKTVTTDLTQLAAAGELDEVIGREDELRRLIAVLGRKEINNPVILGEAGVGKTKLVDALALRIAGGNIDARLQGKRILSLDLGMLVAGTGYRGQFEERMKQLVDEVTASDGDIILFIDEIHQLLGLGKSGGAMDAANLLKPPLARGKLRVIGATTFSEYKALERDPALRRRFEAVNVPEQSMDVVEQILLKIAPSFGEHHNVVYPPATLRSIVRLGRRYLGDTRSPAREIGLLDELGSYVTLMKHVDDDDVGEASDGLEEISDQPAAPIEVTVGDVGALIGRQTGIPVEKLAGDRRERVANMEGILLERVFGQDHAVRSSVDAVQRSLAGLGHPERPRAILFYAGPSGTGKTELAKAVTAELFDSESNMIRLDMSEFSAETARNRLVGSDPGYVGYEEGGRLTEAVRRRPYSLVLLDEFEKAHPTVWRMFLQVFDDGRMTDSQGRTVNFANTVVLMTSNAGALLLSIVANLRTRLEGPDGETRESVEAAVGEALRELPSELPSSRRILIEVANAHLSDGEFEGPTNEQIVREALLAIPGFPPELFSRIGAPIVFDTLREPSLRAILRREATDLCVRLATARSSEMPSLDADPRENVTVTDAEGGLTATWRCEGTATVELRLSAETTADLLVRGYDPLIGARALRNAFESTISTTVARQVLSSDAAGDLTVTV